MAQVPSVPTPSLTPTTAPLNGAAPAAAFGASDVGEGLGKLGGAAEQVSDALAKHAESLQAMTNKADSDTNNVAYTQKAATAWEQFKANNPGAAAEKNLPQFLTGLEKLRADQATNLTNPTAVALFNSDSRNLQTRVSTYAASFAAEEARKYHEQAHVAAQKTALDAVAITGDFDGAMKDVAQRQAVWDMTHGVPPEQGKLNVQTLYSGAVQDRTKIMADQGPPQAAVEFLDAHKGGMSPKAYADTLTWLTPKLRANEAAQGADAAVGAANGAHATPSAVAAELTGLGATITSSARTPTHNAEVGGVPTSEHVPGQGVAYDLVPPKGMTLQQLAAEVKQRAPDAHQVIVESDHVHVGWSQAQVAQYAARVSVNSATGGPASAAELEGRMGTVVAAAQAFAQRTHPGDAAFEDLTVAKARSNQEVNIQAQRGKEVAGFTDLLTRVESGKIQDPSTLLSQPGVAAVYNGLPGSYLRQLDSAMHANANEVTPERYTNMTQLAGVYANRATNPNAYLNTDITHMDLPNSVKLAEIKKQDEFRAKPVSDPQSKFIAQVVKSPEWVASQHDLGVKTNSPDYFHMLGAFGVEMDQWNAGHPNAPPQKADVAKMIANVTAQTPYHTGLSALFGVKGMTDPKFRNFGHITDDERTAASTYLQSKGRPVNELEVGRLVYGARMLKRGGQ